MKNIKKLLFFQKRSFLLLELLIAISIIAISSLTIIRNPVYFFRSQLDTLTQLEYERVADLSLCEIKTQLYTNLIKFDDLITNKENSTIYSLKTLKINIPKICTKKVYRHFRVWRKKNKQGPNSTSYSLLMVEVYLTKNAKITKKAKTEFIYRIFAQKQSI